MPRVRMRDAAGTLRTITRIRMRDAAGTLRTITRVRMRDASNVLRTVFENMSAAIATSIVGFADGAAGSGTVTTTAGDALVTVAGGTSPYTYAWTRVSGDAVIAISSPTSSSPTFSALVSTQRFAVWHVTVTDNVGTVVVSNDMEVELDWTNSS